MATFLILYSNKVTIQINVSKLILSSLKPAKKLAKKPQLFQASKTDTKCTDSYVNE